MKNFVVWTNCNVVSEDPGTQARLNIARCDNPEARTAYDTMHRISRLTAAKFLQGEWEAIVWTDPAPSRLEIFKRNWYRIRDLWHQEPCNVLYLDSDTMMIRITEIFGRFQEFRLFNWTDPKSTKQFEHLFNAGVRYYPASMSEDLWQVGDSMAAVWRDDNWNMEQEIFNTMFWQQPIPDYDRHHPELNWQGMRLTNPDPRTQQAHEQWNQCAFSSVHIMHVHGSRGPEHTAQVMTRIAKPLGIQP
jgi:hypothetical protein